jgi:hypothetical protein
MEAIRSSETSVLIRATRRHLPEDDNHQIFSILIVLASFKIYFIDDEYTSVAAATFSSVPSNGF